MVLDISHNFDRGIPEIEGFLERDVPYAFSQGMIGTAFRIRQHIIGPTWDQAFERRNSRFAALNWRIDTSGAQAQALSMFKRGLAGSMRVTVMQQALKSRGGTKKKREYLARHATGGIKRTVDGGGVAIPADPNQKRLAGGAIPKAQRPTAIRNKKSGFVIGKGNKRRVVVRRKGDLETKFLLRNSARIDKAFRFYEDATMIGMRDIDVEIALAMSRVASKRRSRFFRVT